MIGMLFCSGAVFGALCGLVWQLSPRTRTGLLLALLAGVSMIFAAVRAGKVKA